jgi:methionine-rich copper-binding protein CopC
MEADMTLKRALPALTGCAVLIAVIVLVERAPAATPDMHLRLVRAVPAADTTIAVAPTEVKLYFSEVPQVRVTTVKLINAAKQEFALGEAKADANDGKIVSAPVTTSVAAGTWTVTWRTMARDGHVVSGEYRFTLKPGQ